MTKLRVAVVTRFPYTQAEAFSGLVQVSLRLCNALVQRDDIDLHVVSISDKITKIEQRQQNGYTVTFLPRGTGAIYYGSLCFSAAFAIRQTLHHLKPDVVHAQAVAETVIGSILSDLPTVTTIHGVYQFETASEGSSLEAKIARRIIVLNERWYVRRVKDVISCSPYVTRFVQQRNPNARFYDISNPIDPAFFTVDIQQTKPQPHTILLLGSVSHRKGHDVMVKALSLLTKDFPDIQLSIVGNEVEAAFVSTVKQMIHDNHLSSHVRWLGSISQEQLLEEMKQHQIVCLPSRGETLPMALSQAMTVGNLCVASDAGGIPDMIQDGINGFLFPSENATALAETLTTVMNLSHEQIERLRQQNRAFAEKTYNPDSVAQQSVDVYRTVLQRKS